MSSQADPFSTVTGLSAQSQQSGVINPDYVSLVHAWVNERRCPELLAYEERTVESIMNSLRAQRSLISARQAQWSVRESHIRDLLTMEADRVAYVLKGYLRVRLLKLEVYGRFYIEFFPHFLSQAEITFASNLLKASDETMQSMFLRHLPQGDEYFQSLVASDDPGGEMVKKPDLKKTVFVRVNEPVGAISVGDESVNLDKDKMYIVKYDLVRDFVLDKRISLI